MRLPVSRPLVVAALALTGVALAGCSFRGAVTVGPAGPTSSPAASSAPATPVPSTTPSPTSPASTTPSTTTPPPTTATTSTPPPTSAPPATGGSTPTGPVGVCTSGQLVAALAPADAPVGTGAAVVTLTNTSTTACHLKGFGGISLARSDGAPVLSRQVRTDATPPALTLAPGDVARSQLTWSTVANTAVGEPATGQCEAVPTSLRVIPPDQIDAAAVPWSAGPVCDQGTITQTPYTRA